MSMDADFISTLERQRRGPGTFAVATVVAVSGSSSARVGAKAIFDRDGRNVHGWVGGGCAERFVSEQVLAAISEGRPRIVTARLDDEVLGLGVACGGRMDVFIDPVHPAEAVSAPRVASFSSEIQELADRLSLRVDWDTSAEHAETPRTYAEALALFAQSLARSRGRSGNSLRLVRDLPLRFGKGPTQLPRRVLVLGNSRITESLARLLAACDFDLRVIGPGVSQENYPDRVVCSCLHANFGNIDFSAQEAVIVASQLPVDFGLVTDALASGAPYVAMVGSRSRVLDLYRHLNLLGEAPVDAPLFAPAGLDIDARGPGEIALSIAAEIVELAGAAPHPG